MADAVGVVSEVSEKPLRSLSSFSSRAHFAKVKDQEVEERGKGGSPQWRITDFTDGTDRWSIVCRLLAAPERESHRLARLLERLPVERRRFECHDDVKRRRAGR